MNNYLDRTLRVRRSDDPVPFAGVIMKPHPKMQSSPGFLHFSVALSIAEEAAWKALKEEHAVPAQVSAWLLRPATLNGGNVSGQGEVIRKGKGVMVAKGEAWQATKHICTVVVTFVRFEKQEGAFMTTMGYTNQA